MPLASRLKERIAKEIFTYSGKKEALEKITSIQGGDIHSAYKISTSSADYFLKTSKDTPSSLFETEFEGLQLLKQQEVISIASPISYGQSERDGFLLMEFIEKSAANQSFWKDFARGIAELHQCTHSYFGLQKDNFIGALPQVNTFNNNWSDFFISQRLQPLIKRCIDNKLLDTSFSHKSQSLYKQIPNIFPEEKPALLHGDLWGGNYLCGPSAKPVLFDPAVYYGNREIDLAMTRLFGGFDRQFYWHYDNYFPLSPGWQKRITLCQLYPLLVHSLLFGGGYVQRVRTIIEEYG